MSDAPATARELANRAAELLELIDRQELELDRIREQDADRHLQLAASGALGQLSRDRVWTRELAQTYALAAIAMTGADRLDR